MEDKIVVAIIAGSVSFVVGCISFISSWVAVRSKQLELERQIQSNCMDKLFSMRLEFYPKAFEITEELTKRPAISSELKREGLLLKLEELYVWRTGVVSLIISGDALEKFRKVRDCLQMGYASNNGYSEEQIDKIFNTVADFRRQLRSDIGFLHKADQMNKIRYGQQTDRNTNLK